VNEPQKGIILMLYKIYLKIFLIFSVKLLDKSDFQYLTTSMGVFPRGKQLIKLLGEFNFELVKYKRFTFDVCSAYLLRKNNTLNIN
jgi:demethylmenaquinone methyltransferase/2-methoxy-6-polyprenyl-1,4-benzoquinol methylase